MVLIRKGGPYNRSTLLLRHPDIFFVETMMNNENDFIPSRHARDACASFKSDLSKVT